MSSKDLKKNKWGNLIEALGNDRIFNATPHPSEGQPWESKRVGAVLTRAMAAAWVEGYHAYLKAHDTTEPTMEVDGTTYRWKMASPKEFLTPGGPMVLTRSLYQADSGGKCHVPLDAAWGMMG